MDISYLKELSEQKDIVIKNQQLTIEQKSLLINDLQQNHNKLSILSMTPSTTLDNNPSAIQYAVGKRPGSRVASNSSLA